MEAHLLLLLSALLAGTVALPQQAEEAPHHDRSLLERFGGLTGKTLTGSGGRGLRDPRTRIVRGKEATEGQFPYMAAIMLDQMYFCGGSILSTSWILTAGHCVKGYSRWDVTVGVTDKSNLGDNGVTMTSSEAHYYPGYNEPTDKDVAVIRLPKDLSYTDLIQPTKLPTRADANQDLVGKQGHISGWGFLTRYGPGSEVQSKLRWASQTVISKEECSTRLRTSIILTADYLVCGFSPVGQRTCAGDSGGPFVLDESGVQVGIHSFSTTNCQDIRTPSAYSRAAFYLDWISNTTGVELP